VLITIHITSLALFHFSVGADLPASPPNCCSLARVAGDSRKDQTEDEIPTPVETAQNQLFQFMKICNGPKLTIDFSGAKIYGVFSMIVDPYPQLLSMKSDSNALFSSSS
jgi:hypothetical protein